MQQVKYSGKALLELRTSQKLTVKAIAEDAKVGAGAWSDYERDKKSPTVRQLRKIAQYFGVEFLVS